MLVDEEISRSFKEPSTCENKECRNRFTVPLLSRHLKRYRLLWWSSLSQTAGFLPSPDIVLQFQSHKFYGTSISDVRGWYSIDCPLVIDVCVAGIVKRLSSDFVHSWDSWWTKAIFTSRREICLRVSLAAEMFSFSCLEANCFFLVVLSFFYLFFTSAWLRRILGR